MKNRLTLGSLLCLILVCTGCSNSPAPSAPAKWMDKTTLKGVDAASKAVAAGSVDSHGGLKEGSKVSVKYTEQGGEKTAVVVKDASKDTAKAVVQ